MKKIIFILLVLQFGLQILNAQWVQQTSNTNNALLNIKFYDNNTGFISGYGGVMLKTTNSGSNWTVTDLGLSGKFMNGLCVVNQNVIYSVGFYETIIKSTNGGVNWTFIKNGPYGQGHSYEAVYFINENTGWICGSGSLIFKTTNGGVSFDSVNIPVGYLFDIYFRNENEGLVCGEAATMYRTTNGGSNWQEIIVPVGNEAANFNRLSIINDSIIYTQGVQNNKIYKSYNFGNTWDSVARVFGADDSYTLCFPNELTGWCAGSFGLMYKTTNGGYNWQQVDLSNFNTAYFRGFWFKNDSSGWAIGGLGKILYTTNGGLTFVSSETKISADFKLHQNYPNPFNSSTLLSFDVMKYGDYKLEIYNSLGQVIEKFCYLSLNPGHHKLNFNSSSLSSGVYYYKLSSNNNTITKSMVLIR